MITITSTENVEFIPIPGVFVRFSKKLKKKIPENGRVLDSIHTFIYT